LETINKGVNQTNKNHFKSISPFHHRKYFGFQIIQQGFEHIGGIAKKMIEEVKHTRGITKEMI
jgi:beta-galactosidase beta subunit